jgi:hypothetical protein
MPFYANSIIQVANVTFFLHFHELSLKCLPKKHFLKHLKHLHMPCKRLIDLMPKKIGSIAPDFICSLAKGMLLLNNAFIIYH